MPELALDVFKIEGQAGFGDFSHGLLRLPSGYAATLLAGRRRRDAAGKVSWQTGS
jgi:hypothetical protein